MLVVVVGGHGGSAPFGLMPSGNARVVEYRNLHIVGRRARVAYVLIAGTMLCLLIFRGLNHGGLPKGLQHWHTTIAFFAGVPAISWVLLSALGVMVLSRAGSERAWK